MAITPTTAMIHGFAQTLFCHRDTLTFMAIATTLAVPPPILLMFNYKDLIEYWSKANERDALAEPVYI